jgi:aldehyde dehydrogenase (NAD+)
VSHVRQEAKGLVLIISPWNFPFLLTLRPLASAIAAGNTVIIKTSEHAPHSAACMEQLVQDVFDPDEVRLIQGDATVAQRLLKLPFNHIFFTGSTAVGKIVMEAASQHLSSVTLELGGKSPVIIVKDADVTKAAADIAWGRTLNSGQACVAPDYVLIHEDHLASFVAQYQQQITRMYGDDPSQDSSLARIINLHHFRRLRGLLEDAARQGAQISVGGQTNEADLYIAPTLLTNVTPQMKVMQEEIFGPILPVMTFRDRDEAVARINALPRPLSMYVFARQAPDVDYFLARIMCGDVVINNCVIHFGHSKLGVGGSNSSGIGKGLGHAGFLEFTHERGVMQHKMLDFSMLFPSYNNKLTQTILRWYYKLG